MARGGYEEPPVHAADLGSKFGKERFRPLDRGDYHLLNPSQILEAYTSFTQLPPGDHARRSGAPFSHKMLYLRRSQGGPRQGKLRDKGMGLLTPSAAYP